MSRWRPEGTARSSEHAAPRVGELGARVNNLIRSLLSTYAARLTGPRRLCGGVSPRLLGSDDAVLRRLGLRGLFVIPLLALLACWVLFARTPP